MPKTWKIFLNLYENLNLKILYPVQKIISNMDPAGVVQSVYSTISHDKIEWHGTTLQGRCLKYISDRIKLFQIWIKFSNFKTWFVISKKVDFQEVEVLGISFIFCVLGEFIFKST